VTKYMLAVHNPRDPGPRESMTEEEIRRGYGLVAALEEEMNAANALVFSGRLTEPGLATVVRSKGGKVRTTDGPYAEAKEVIGGFYIVEAGTDDEARSWAAKTSDAIGMPIEVRPLWEPARS
jgi:hypothetical protein